MRLWLVGKRLCAVGNAASTAAHESEHTPAVSSCAPTSVSQSSSRGPLLMVDRMGLKALCLTRRTPVTRAAQFAFARLLARVACRRRNGVTVPASLRRHHAKHGVIASSQPCPECASTGTRRGGWVGASNPVFVSTVLYGRLAAHPCREVVSAWTPETMRGRHREYSTLRPTCGHPNVCPLPRYRRFTVTCCWALAKPPRARGSHLVLERRHCQHTIGHSDNRICHGQSHSVFAHTHCGAKPRHGSQSGQAATPVVL